MTKVIIVGQAPSTSRGSKEAFEGPSGKRLAALAGLGGEDELRRRARLVNVLPSFPGKAGKGDAFPMREARERARRMRLGGVALLAGKGVARAFGVDAPYFEWVPLRTGVAAVIPHPSGVSHWWNDPANVARAREFVSAVFL